jgi:starch phosphorylase
MTGDELREALDGLARNLAYSWTAATRGIFRDLDPSGWGESDHNPVVLLSGVSDDRLDRVASDESFVARVEAAQRALAEELVRPGWWDTQAAPADFLVAYFSTEFALDESIPVYSGGLGVLAGDHLKSASELDVPLVGVGLFYDRGYFRQWLDETGWQRERYPLNDPRRLPLTLECDASGTPLHVHIELAGEPVTLRIWRADAGRTRLYLLDANVTSNSAAARAVTDRLYGGDREHRIRQEVALGIGGVRALRKLDLTPSVFHMNEGHSAFLVLERLRELTAAGIELEHAQRLVRAGNVFTTHTPVPAGNEVFAPELVRRYLAGPVAAIGLEWEAFLALGRALPADREFGLTPFALRSSGRANGVSALHGEVAREMWQPIWPDRAVADVPIGHITNGVHARTWLGRSLADRLAGEWSRVGELADEELWSIHTEQKDELLTLIRAGREIAGDADVLTIGFARRFATYKRAGLLFSDPDRLAALVADPSRPLRIVLAGKAHPADEEGKQLIREIWELSQEERFAGRVVFCEDYEMTLARRIVHGVDVWLNTPRRPQEASGTSGMKAAMNGGVNLSILDGWWDEGFDSETGFAIAGGDDDIADAATLYRVLADDVLPAYYDRDERALPPRWLALMRASIERLGTEFNTNRMVREYVETMYLPAHAAAAEATTETPGARPPVTLAPGSA